MICARFDLDYPAFSLNVDMTLPDKGVTVVFGQSGSGKTTLLRCIAGLEKSSVGELRVNEEVWQAAGQFVPTHRRPIGYVFQEATLFPHLSVRGNLEFGYKRTAPAKRRIQFDRVVFLLGLDKLMARSNPARLSGGEKQRLAIGRALLASPSLLLMDEPLSGLDASSKQEVLSYLEQLSGELAIPVIYVSHELDEVTRLADHLVLLRHGRIMASGALDQMLSRLDLPLSHLDDAGAVLEAKVAVHDDSYHLTRLDFSGGSFWVSRVQRKIGTFMRVRVLARDVSVATTAPVGSSITNILPAQIVGIQEETPDRLSLRLEVGGGDHILLSRITRRSSDQLRLERGMAVFAQVKSVALMA
jgi:molybdate transport system ATP-binding protein